VEPDSPAARLGLQAGDFISHVNGVPVTSPREFQRVVEKLTDDASLTLVDGRMIVVPQSP
jgi:S1-C subfamily serine protease